MNAAGGMRVNNQHKKKQYPLFRSVSGILFGLVLIGYYLVAGSIGGFHLSVLWVWLAAGLTIIVLGMVDLWMWFHPIRPVRVVVALLRWIIIGCAAAFFSVVYLVMSDMHYTCPVHADYLIVPGAKVYGDQPSDALRARIDLAWDYLSQSPDTVAILSGGQGSGENISEAECMRRVLMSYGLTEDRIRLEEKSTTTAENMQFSYALYGDPDASVGIVTSNFHLYRSIRLAKKCGWTNVYGIPAPFSGILLPHYIAREFLTVTVDTLRGNM